ncbi:MAG: hypothetical protein M3Y21_06860 [Candidatus Eremiobacteraeota bacterium]|nr:hypothetical protein [Candidatus Eremiobacteraeota bacterium]
MTGNSRVFLIAAALVVVLGIALSFSLLGTPAHARLIALDQQRARDLAVISAHLYNHYGNKDTALPTRLPTKIDALPDQAALGYTYRRITSTQYHLCATFALASDSSGRTSSGLPTTWTHPSGKTCYALDASLTPPNDPPRAKP